MQFPVTEHVAKTPRHTTFHLVAGPAQGPVLLFLHGWPELSHSWRHQLRCLGAMGLRCIAPDMRGYGRSSVYPELADYAMEHIVGDMLELLDALGEERAVFVGHDWGAEVVWSIARNHPERVRALANLCVPYLPGSFCHQETVPLVDRTLYPEAQFPVGQWDYHFFYEENFARASAVFHRNPVNTIKALFRKGNPAARGQPGRLAHVRRDGGWFGCAEEAPDLPLDTDVITAEDLHAYASALARNGFFGPDAWYMNAEANRRYAAQAASPRLAMPVLFLHGAYDYTCDTTASRLADPMREHCADLEERVLPTGHWMAQERPDLVNAALVRWLATRVPEMWPA